MSQLSDALFIWKRWIASGVWDYELSDAARSRKNKQVTSGTGDAEFSDAVRGLVNMDYHLLLKARSPADRRGTQLKIPLGERALRQIRRWRTRKSCRT